MIDLGGPHWRFAVDVYDKEGVSASCLYLQDNYGVDVNILLLSLYATQFLGIEMKESRIGALDDAARQQRDVVIHPLRQVRRDLRSIAEDAESKRLREMIQQAELFAEQYQQARLAEILMAWARPEDRTELELTGHAVVRFYASACSEAIIGPLATRAINIITQSVRSMHSTT